MTRRRSVLLLAAALAGLGLVAWRSTASDEATEPSPTPPPVAALPSDHPPRGRARAGLEDFPEGGLERPARATAPLDVADAGHDSLADPAALRRAGMGLEVAQWLRKNAEAAERNVDRFCEENEKLSAAKAGAEPGQRADAATYLAVRVDWEGGRTGLLHLPEALTTRLRGLPQDSWPRAIDERDWAGLDFSWLSELQAFDHWSMSGDGPLKNQDSIEFSSAPIPNYLGLMWWAKLRLAKGLREGQLERASAEVRHLGDLCGSSGTLVGEMIRVSVLRFDRLAWEASGLPIPETSNMTAELASAVRRAGLAAPYFLYPGVPREVQQKALGCGLTRCSQLLEALGAAAMFRDFVPDAEAQLAWLVAQRPCDLRLAEKIRSGPPPSLETMVESFTPGPGADRWDAPDAGP